MGTRWIIVKDAAVRGAGCCLLLLVVACGRFRFDSIEPDATGPDAPAETDAPAGPDADTTPDAPICVLNACGGCTVLAAMPGAPCGGSCGTYVCTGLDSVVCGESTNVLVNGDFNTGPSCQALTVPGWTVTASGAWAGVGGRPMIQDNTACGVGASWGCSTMLTGVTSGTCLGMWGDATTVPGEWIELSQAVTAPGTITDLRLSYARSTQWQWTFDWQYEVFLEMNSQRMLIERVTDINITGSIFSSGLVAAVEVSDTATVVVRIERIGTPNGNGWSTWDNIILDMCWQ